MTDENSKPTLDLEALRQKWDAELAGPPPKQLEGDQGITYPTPKKSKALQDFLNGKLPED
jgi:hypothetical protein